MPDPIYFNDPDALVTATYYCENEIFERLITAGADVNCTNEHGETSLHTASQEGWEHLVIRLLECGADPNRPDKKGDTPWDYAVFYEHPEIKAILEQHGAVQQSRKSACQLEQEQMYESYCDEQAIKRLINLMEESKKQKS